MASFDSLAGDQRAVLQLVLARRRGYEEISGMLAIPFEAVRARALVALDALAPASGVAADERQLICDYLLSQLPAGEQERAQRLLARSGPARAWAVALTPALEPVAVDPLPRIPPRAPDESAAAPAAEPVAVGAQEPVTAAPADEPPAGAAAEPAGAAASERGPSSRRGGIVVIALALAVIVAAVVVLLVTHHHSHQSPAGLAASTHSPGVTTSTPTTSTTTSSTSSVKYLAQINLRPVAAGSKAVGIAEILEQNGRRAIAIIGQHIPPNTKSNSYEVWLYSSPTHFEKLGFVSPAVKKAGTFSDARALPGNAHDYHELIVTTETAEKPAHPGPILLRGTLTGLS